MDQKDAVTPEPTEELAGAFLAYAGEALTDAVADIAMRRERLNNRELAVILNMVQTHASNGDYPLRNRCVILAVYLAISSGYRAGFSWDGQATDPKILDGNQVLAFIELPTGQVSWHLPEFPFEWDGHSTEEKNRRVHAYIGEVQP